MLRLVRIPDAEQRLDEYPHQLSGGMRQRVDDRDGARVRPALLIADEPTTALDVTIQAQILELLLELQARSARRSMLITHDLGVVAEICQRVIVMYAGARSRKRRSRRSSISPLHPYTQGLMAAIPRRRHGRRRGTARRDSRACAVATRGDPGLPLRAPLRAREERCRRERATLAEIAPGHGVRACGRAAA